MQKIGVLLINLGTPDNCDIKSVRRYLKEFLSDPRVIDLPSPARWLLLNAVILPFRPKKSAKAYQKIWLPSGSPLLTNGYALKEALTNQLGENYQVEIGMRYGNPSIATAIENLKHCKRLIILPLFPQYSSAATGSALEKCLSLISKHWNIPQLTVINDFYNHRGFINAYAEIIKCHLEKQEIDLLLFSYHGLPERHIHKSACAANCAHIDSCPIILKHNQYCYRAQCYATSHALANAIGLAPNKYAVSFQSRLGRTPWIKPYTDELFAELRQKNIGNIAIVCPSFVADCLETLEEISIRGKEQWQALGGKTFISIPCLNAEPLWVNALVDMVMTQN